MRHQRQSRACDDDHRYHHVVAIERRRARARSNREERQPHWGQPVHTRSQSASSPNGSTGSAPGHQRCSLNCAARLGQSIGNDLRVRLYHHLQELSLAYYNTTSTLAIVTDTLSLLAMIVVMFVLRWDFALIALAVTPLLAAFVLRVNKAVRTAVTEVRTRQSDLLATMQEGLQSIEVVKAPPPANGGPPHHPPVDTLNGTVVETAPTNNYSPQRRLHTTTPPTIPRCT